MKKRVSFDQITTIAFEAVAVLMCCYHILYAVKPQVAPVQNQIIHLGFVLVLFYLRAIKNVLTSEKKGKTLRIIVNAVLMAVSFYIEYYLFANYMKLVNSMGVYTLFNFMIGLMLCLVLMDSVIRGFGKALAIIYAVFMAYAYFGKYIPGFFHHNGFSWQRIIASVTTNFTGVFGQVLDVSASFITLFMIFGGLLEASGAGKFFVDIALAIGGHTRSGPAQAAVLGSCLVGSINGSAVANVATTGVFTIPMMKDRGYEPKFAGAVEAVASTGGQIMPPVMGSGAFIMAGILGVSYSKIAISAIIPALLYYLTAGITVHLHALKNNMQPLPPEQRVDIRKVFKEGWYNSIPIIAVFYMLISGMSVARAGYWGILSTILVYLVSQSVKTKSFFLLKKDFWVFLKNAFVSGAANTITVATACAVMGIVAQIVNITGLSLKIVYQLKVIAGSAPFIAVLLTALISIFFGMGVPTTASYVMVAIIAAPVLIDFGFYPIAVHLFIFYYAILANITPPIATAALVASRMADADYMETGWQAVKIGITGFLIPFAFIYHTELLMNGSVGSILFTCLMSVLGVTAIAIVSEKWFLTKVNVWERIVFLICGALMFWPEHITSIIGLVLFAVMVIEQKRKASRHKLAEGK